MGSEILLCGVFGNAIRFVKNAEASSIVAFLKFSFKASLPSSQNVARWHALTRPSSTDRDTSGFGGSGNEILDFAEALVPAS